MISGHSGKKPELGGVPGKKIITNRDAVDAYAPPTGPERAVQAAHDEKVHATREWVAGRISSREHAAVHKRADYVIKKKGHM
jgi:hypothetical protein